MIEDVLLYLVAMALVFAVNIVPAFMPATWMVLAFFRIKFGLPLLALSIGGSIIAATGRWALAKASALFSRRFMKGQQSDMRELGEFLDEHRQHVGLATFLYTLSPLPSNNLFIAAGMVEIQLVWVFAGFLSGRLIANTALVWTTDKAFRHFEELFAEVFGSWEAILFQSLSVFSIVLLTRVPWAKWLRRYVRSPKGEGPTEENTASSSTTS